ncbi:protein of unknown function [Pseudomonas inefficax]|uniref:Uncharacterized protein n=1 Tax=Pseudomonas inefficax TaxID=2078786 RepID=A0AAQ1P9A2_9PSED|nr:protein of unknown function [Pseudomonas inefficax]
MSASAGWRLTSGTTAKTLGAALRPIATQGRSYRRMQSLVGAALCRDGLHSSPNSHLHCP